MFKTSKIKNQKIKKSKQFKIKESKDLKNEKKVKKLINKKI